MILWLIILSLAILLGFWLSCLPLWLLRRDRDFCLERMFDAMQRGDDSGFEMWNARFDELEEEMREELRG